MVGYAQIMEATIICRKYGQLGCDMGDLMSYVAICTWFGAVVLVCTVNDLCK
jgi:hypothetical protein